MSIKEITQGGMITALLVVLGICMSIIGGGYWLYLDMMAPILIVLTYLKCGNKVGGMVSFSTLCLIFLLQGDIGGCVYLMQSFGLSFICAQLLRKKYGMMEDMLLASLGGCLLIFIFDPFIKVLTGVSLLDDLSLYGLKEWSVNQINLIYHVSIVAVPLVSMLMIYIGSLLLGNYLHLLDATQGKKYKQIKYYKQLSPWIYCSTQTIQYSLVSIVAIGFLTPYLKRGYIRTLCISVAIILLYFVVQDLIKRCMVNAFRYVGEKKMAKIINGREKNQRE